MKEELEIKEIYRFFIYVINRKSIKLSYTSLAKLKIN